MSPVSAEAQQRILNIYTRRTPLSGAAHARAAALLPGGVNRQIVHHPPYPLFLKGGAGARVEDLDGHSYLDMIGNYTSMILGHAHPAVVAAAKSQADHGTAWNAASSLEADLAEELATRFRSIERVRFTASGTEATLMAMRAARAYTGRSVIAKFEGGYHGLHDYAMVSVAPPIADAGPPDAPVGCAPPGIPKEVVDSIVVLPFNRPEAVEAIVTRRASEIAGVIVEPILGVAGCISPQPGFLQFVRDLTARLGIVLIFDEVITFRLAFGGAQESFGVDADLTTLGKIIGGGFPIGAVAGREEIMRVFDPSTGPKVLLSGTFHASPVALAAGMATLRLLTGRVIEVLNARGDRFRDQLAALFAGGRRPARVTGAGSLFTIHFTGEPVTDYRASARADKQLAQWLYLALLNEGVLLTPRGMGCLSVGMTEEDCDFFFGALRRASIAIGLQ